MKTRMQINGIEFEGYLREKHIMMKKGQTWRDCNSDALLALDDPFGDLREQRAFDFVLHSRSVTIHVIRFVVEDGTFVFAWWDPGKDTESRPLPQVFNAADGENFGTFFDSDGTRLFDANNAKRKHTIKESKLWQKKKRAAMAVSADIIRQELAPVMEGMKDISKSVRAVGQREANLEKDKTALRKANEVLSDMLTICESAKYAGVNERTIRNWLGKVNGDGSPMILGVIGKGRLTRIPRKSLEPFRKRVKATPNKSCKRSFTKSRHRGLGAKTI